MAQPSDEWSPLPDPQELHQDPLFPPRVRDLLPPREASRTLVPRWGAIHVHTDHSDGGITLPDTVAAAQEAGLDFLTITDHNTLAGRACEGYHDRLLLQVEVEITPASGRDHYLALGLPALPAGLHRCPLGAQLAEVEAVGGTAWVAHPLGYSNPWLAQRHTPWPLWEGPVGGIDLSTYLVEWAMRLRPWNLLRHLRHPALPHFPVRRQALALWDALNEVHPTVGFVGIDAHSRTVWRGRLRTPPYPALLATHNLVVWTPEPTGDAALDLERLRAALVAGRFVNILGTAGPREPVRFQRIDDHLLLELPPGPGFEVRLLCNGREAQIPGCRVRPGGSLLWRRPPAGIFRAEVYCQGQLWALTNPLVVTAAARAPVPANAPGRARFPVASWPGSR